jgi:hypothetical protein
MKHIGTNKVQLTLKMRLSCCLKMLGINHLVTRHHIAEEQKPQQHGRKSLKTPTIYIIFVYKCITCFVNKNCRVVWSWAIFASNSEYLAVLQACKWDPPSLQCPVLLVLGTSHNPSELGNECRILFPLIHCFYCGK